MKQFTARFVSSDRSNLSKEVLSGDLLNLTISAYSFHVHSFKQSKWVLLYIWPGWQIGTALKQIPRELALLKRRSLSFWSTSVLPCKMGDLDLSMWVSLDKASLIRRWQHHGWKVQCSQGHTIDVSRERNQCILTPIKENKTTFFNSFIRILFYKILFNGGSQSTVFVCLCVQMFVKMCNSRWLEPLQIDK